METAG